ncbi:helix-turn-helix domain-containing protein [Nostocoides australiense]
MNPDQAAELGKYLRKKREAYGISIRKLSHIVGVDQAQIIRLEQGKVASPKADLLDRIATEINVPVSDLMTLAGYPMARGLPGLRPYMRAKYKDLPPDAVEEVESFIARLQAKHGGRPGPTGGEDET